MTINIKCNYGRSFTVFLPKHNHRRPSNGTIFIDRNCLWITSHNKCQAMQTVCVFVFLCDILGIVHTYSITMLRWRVYYEFLFYCFLGQILWSLFDPHNYYRRLCSVHCGHQQKILYRDQIIIDNCANKTSPKLPTDFKCAATQTGAVFETIIKWIKCTHTEIYTTQKGNSITHRTMVVRKDLIVVYTNIFSFSSGLRFVCALYWLATFIRSTNGPTRKIIYCLRSIVCLAERRKEKAKVDN